MSWGKDGEVFFERGYRMALVDVVITGKSELLMHRFPLDPVAGIDKLTKEEQCEIAAYRDPEGKLYFPGSNLQRALMQGGAYTKKGRSNLSKIVSASVFVSPEYLITTPQEYHIDSRSVVIKATQGRIVRHRPALPIGWAIKCQIEYDETLLSAAELRKIVDDTGRLVGIGDYRPATKGPFGRFDVTSWAPVT
jgi:hypothetical protein